MVWALALGEFMAIFLKGTKHPFLNFLGIGYGELIIEGYRPIFLSCRDGAKRTVARGIEKQLLTVDEAMQIETSMAQAGCPENMMTVMDKVRGFELPTNFRPSFKFVRCTECVGAEHLAPHGYVVMLDEGGGETICSGLLHDFESGYRLCDMVLMTHEAQALDGVLVLKQMIEVGVLTDMTATRKHYNELPAEIRERIETQTHDTNSVEVTSISGFGMAIVLRGNNATMFLDSLFGGGR